MASKALASPLVRHITARGYAQAAPSLKESALQTSVLANKTVVAALDNGSPVTRLTVAFRAGSRYEPANDLGVAHVLRSAAGMTTKKASAFIMSRKLSQIGASVTASGDREFIYYTLETSKASLNEAIEVLTNLINDQEFRPWELNDNAPRLSYDIVSLTPQVRAVDLLHKAAYRRGLGNSLFISPKRIGKISSESMQHFAASTLQANRCAVAVVGDSLDRAALVAQQLQGPTNDCPAEASKYYGGELRKEMSGELSHIALALQGAPAGSSQALALAVAAKALGNGPVTKWGSDNSPIAKAIGNIGPFAAAGFNVNYSDNGLFGVVLSVPKDEAQAALKGVAKLLKSPSLPASAIKAGKAQLKLQVLAEAEEGTALAESLAVGALGGGARSPTDIAALLDNLSDNDVQQALSNAAKSKLSMGAAGNLSNVPYVDEL